MATSDDYLKAILLKPSIGGREDERLRLSPSPSAAASTAASAASGTTKSHFRSASDSKIGNDKVFDMKSSLEGIINLANDTYMCLGGNG